MNGWTDDSDLPQLQSIELGRLTFTGNRKTTNPTQYNDKSTLTMRSDNECVREWIDLPSLTRLKGSEYTFSSIESVILNGTHIDSGMM